MATDFISFTADNYVPDRGLTGLAKGFNYKGRFSRPPGMNDAQVTDILSLIGGTPPVAGQSVPCDASSVFEPRRLKFSFKDGGSISVPAPDRTKLKTLATDIKGALASGFGADFVVCVSLIGEHWGRLDEELRPTGVVPAPGADVRATTGGKNPTYSINMQYHNDAGVTFAKSARMATDTIGGTAPFSRYAFPIATALGTPLPVGCGNSSNVDPRHYVMSFLTTSTDNPIRQMNIPVASEQDSVIRSVGVEIATNTQTLCLEYYGESDGRFGRFLP